MDIDGKWLKASFIAYLKTNIRDRRQEYKNKIHLLDLLYCPHKVRFNKESDYVSDALAINVHRGDGLLHRVQKYFDQRFKSAKSDIQYHMNLVLVDKIYKVYVVPHIVIRDLVVQFEAVTSIRRSRHSGEAEIHTHHLAELMYAMMVTNAKSGILMYYDILKSDIATFDLHESEIDKEFYVSTLTHCLEDYLKPPKVAEPRYVWECKFCEKRSCPRNINKEVL